MKLLLDENLPHRLRKLLVGHDVFTVSRMKWNGIKNGELLRLAASESSDALVTKDNGMPYEQNLVTLPCSIVVLKAVSNSMRDIEPLVPSLLSALQSLQPKTVLRIS